MGLNEQQQQAVDLAVQKRANGDKKFAVLGAGGTGKTYTAREVIKAVTEDKPVKTLVLAPTNKALRVIKSSMDGLNADFKTIHSGLGLQPEFNEIGRLEFNSGTNNGNAFDDYSVVMVDEISMVNSQLKDKLVEECEIVGATLIGLGDQYQHFPVKEKSCPMIDYFEDSSYTLTQVMRQGGNNPVKEPITESRNAVIKGTKNYDPRWSFDETMTIKDESGKEIGYYCFYEQAKVLRQIVRAYSIALKEEKYDFCKVICWQNKSARLLNQQIRQLLFGDYAQQDYIPGDLVICRAPVKQKIQNPVSGKFIDMVVIHTSTECIVNDVFPYRAKYKMAGIEVEYSGWKLSVTSLDNRRNLEIKVVSSKDYSLYHNNHETIRKYCAKAVKDDPLNSNKHWYAYFNHSDLFHNFVHAYTISSHLSQGSTYPNVFVWADDISKNNFDIDVRNRSHYVAISRGSERVIMF